MTTALPARILLISDDVKLQKDIEGIFLDEFEVRSFRNADDAFLALNALEVDLVIADVQTPRLQGFPLWLQRLKKSLPEVPIIVVVESEFWADVARDAGANIIIRDHLFDDRELRTRVYEILSRDRLKVPTGQGNGDTSAAQDTSGSTGLPAPLDTAPTATPIRTPSIAGAGGDTERTVNGMPVKPPMPLASPSEARPKLSVASTIDDARPALQHDDEALARSAEAAGAATAAGRDREKQENYDAFLSYSSQDKGLVTEIARRLQRHGLSVWLDAWQLRPTHLWGLAVEKALRISRVVIVCIGSEGPGLWNDAEINAIRSRPRFNRVLTAIVLLPGCPTPSALATFVKAELLFDLRSGLNEEGLNQLVKELTREMRQLAASGATATASKKGEAPAQETAGTVIGEPHSQLASSSSEPTLSQSASASQQAPRDLDGEGTPQSPRVETATAAILVASVSDLPTAEDHLGFPPYVMALAGFLASERTVPPLTLSIEGTWGSGKSSFMLQLKKALRDGLGLVASAPDDSARGSGRARRQPRCFTIWFNAWRHDKEDALWAAFALDFIRQVSSQLTFRRRLLARSRLFLSRYRWWDGWLELARALAIWLLLAVLCLGLPVALISSHRVGTAIERLGHRLLTEPSRAPGAPREGTRAGGTESTTSFTAPATPLTAAPTASRLAQKQPSQESEDQPWRELIRWWFGLGAGGAYAAGAISLVLKLKWMLGNPLEIRLRQHLRSPDYEGRVAFIETFHEDFRRIVAAYAADAKIYVFIDDLDRCDVPKAADLMQALNLLIADDSHLTFIIGMDREKVAAGLAVKYEKLLPYLLMSRNSLTEAGDGLGSPPGLEYGYTFIEKFIQLPFRVPTPGAGDIDRFLCSIAGSPTRVGEWQKMKPIKVRATGSEDRGEEESETHDILSSRRVAASSRSDANGDLAEHGPDTRGATTANQRSPAASRRILELLDQDDSEALRHLSRMVAPTLGNNPRRLKQFVNLFRLQAYIAAATGGFHELPGKPPLTLEQLAKFVAISLVWPGILADLAEDTSLLQRLEQHALDILPESELVGASPLKRWLRQSAMRPLLRYGCVADPYEPRRYSLAFLDVDRLLRVSPSVPRATDSAVP
jgi:CheY-like chemotaxis protein